MDQRQPLRRVMVTLAATTLGGLIMAPRSLPATAPINPGRDREMPKQEVSSGVVIAFEDQWFGPPWQQGEPIVLLHGVAESHVSWQQWVPLITGQFRTIRPDLPGFGQSPFPASYDCTTARVAAISYGFSTD